MLNKYKHPLVSTDIVAKDYDNIMGTRELTSGKRTLALAAQALERASQNLGNPFVQAVHSISECSGKVVVSGVGKSAHVAAKIASTFNSTGTKALFLHAGEALHGDLGAVEAGDCVLCLSKSGASDEVVALLPALQKRGCTILAMTAVADSPLALSAAIVLDVAVEEEACPWDLAPTTSTSLQLALGDALAVALMEHSGFQPDDFAANHPAGRLGKMLTWTLASLVDPQRKPAVPWSAPLDHVLKVMSEGRYGATVVVKDGRPETPAGIITDGDLRRALAQGSVEGLTAGDLACPAPQTMKADILAREAASWMQRQGISQVVVVKEEQYVGMVHLHDCLREGLT